MNFQQPQILSSIQAVRQWRSHVQQQKLAFVPTMGALHQGHLSLVQAALDSQVEVLVSIFVNPKQFGPQEDLQTYPRCLEQDLKQLQALGVKAIFAPSVEEMYPHGFQTRVQVNGVSQGLCGESRPQFFDGVTTVLAKLFNIVEPHQVYLGQKDWQQTVVVKQLIRDLNWSIDVIVLPTVREHDGLAMSSRNQYLSSQERQQAPVIAKGLSSIQTLVQQGETCVAVLQAHLEKILSQAPDLKVDYISFVDCDTAQAVKLLRPHSQHPTVLALAVFLGSTRLIDNIILE